jgi:hypothetical protein
MKDSHFNSKVIQKLQEFESLEDIQPSAGWNDSLMRKLKSSGSNHPGRSVTARFAIIVILIIAANLGFILNLFNNHSRRSETLSTEYHIISSEFLINPLSANN